ncbi:MAG: hypothetical protein LUE98_21620, partial [Tannerellaceae bacterium]|nr:hypothetical protein [Tannerellaceae bacterium]
MYISPDKNYCITANNNPHPIYWGYFEIYLIDKLNSEITYQASIWSDEQYEDILWENGNIFIKTIENAYYILNVDEVFDRSLSLIKENETFQKDKEWYDIFYFSPFDEYSGETGNYYIHLKGNDKSVFATSFGHKEISFEYKIMPFYNNGIVYLINEEEPEIVAKMVKVDNQYYIDSPYIKLYT